jgi:hypothetical protein
LKSKNWFEIQISLQTVAKPIQTQAKDAFVLTIRSIDTPNLVLGDDLQTQQNHPDISQTSG